MNIYYFLISIALISSCQNKVNKSISSKLSDTTSITYERNLSYSDKKNTKIEMFDISTVLEKMRIQKELLHTDYESINNFVLLNIDESKSEEFGYTFYEYFRKNKRNNKSFIDFLNKQEKNYQETLLLGLINIMCLDLGEENYNYNRLIKDFEFFKNSKSVKNALNDCIGNF
jgi:hypothetical protein